MEQQVDGKKGKGKSQVDGTKIIVVENRIIIASQVLKRKAKYGTGVRMGSTVNFLIFTLNFHERNTKGIDRA